MLLEEAYNTLVSANSFRGEFMKNFKDKVAVITGAASGIGLGLARRCVKEGVKVVLVDIQKEALAQARTDLKAMGGEVIEVIADVSKAEDVGVMAQKTIDAFGQVNLLFNNAGVATYGRIWEVTIKDWEWILNVNLWGVIHGIRTFVPIMLKQDTDAHIVNTASLGGIVTGGPGPYTVSKHGVVALSEGLYRELTVENAKIGISVLCPGPVATPISSLGSATRRPAAYGGTITPTEKMKALMEMQDQINKGGISIDQCATLVFEGIMKNRFYIFTSPELAPIVHLRLDDIREERNPTTFGANDDHSTRE